MATYYVNSVGGSNTAPYDTWASGATAITTVTALAAATDTIYVASDHSETTAPFTITLPTTMGLKVLCADRGSGEPPTTLATGATISGGTATTACAITGNAYFYGINFLGGSGVNSAADLNIGVATTTQTLIFENCQIHCRGNSSGASINLGNSQNSGNDEFYVKLINTAIGIGHASTTILVNTGKIEMVGVTLMGTNNGNLFTAGANSSIIFTATGCDFSGTTWTNLVTALASATCPTFRFSQCKFDAGYTVLSTSATYIGSAEVFINDCDSGDTHGSFAYANALGSVVQDTSIKYTSGAAGMAWKVTTTASASFFYPFVTPWIDLYNTTLTAQTPYLEILRNNDSTSAYKNDEVWVECLAKTAGGSPLSSTTNDRRGLLTANADQDAGAGLGSWENETGSCWSGKLAVASLTPAENGHIRMRVCVGLASITGKLYIDPQIRT